MCGKSMCTKNCLILSVQDLRDHALWKCKKYRFDPHLRREHEEYLEELNMMISQEIYRQKTVLEIDQSIEEKYYDG
jgi:hypothetical protein